MIYLALFLLAASYDVFALLWIDYSQRNEPVKSAIMSVLLGAGSLICIGEALQGWQRGAAILLGYGAGTYVTVLVKRKRTDRSATNL